MAETVSIIFDGFLSKFLFIYNGLEIPLLRNILNLYPSFCLFVYPSDLSYR